MIHQFDNIELEKHYCFFEFLRKKFPVDGQNRIDVSDLVDLESLTLDVRGQLNISLEPDDTMFDSPKYDGKPFDKEEDYDLLSEIISQINDYYGKVPDGTEETVKRIISDIVNDEEVINVLNSDNTDSNKRDKMEQIYDKKNIKTLDSNTKLYEYLEKKENKDRILQMLISRPDLLDKLREQD